jgi:hypothetical protein
MNLHYICTGTCHGVSNQPGECKDDSCVAFGEPLEECDCDDGEHYGAFEAFNEEDEDL